MEHYNLFLFSIWILFLLIDSLLIFYVAKFIRKCDKGWKLFSYNIEKLKEYITERKIKFMKKHGIKLLYILCIFIQLLMFFILRIRIENSLPEWTIYPSCIILIIALYWFTRARIWIQILKN